ncbi:MAG: hypothetical protein R3E55_15525 [Burkholderiaceae bacterium]
MTHSKSTSNRTLSALALTAALAFASTSTLAANDEQDHTEHHPEAPAAVATVPDRGAKVPPQAMQKQIQAMKAMHEKMVNAKTPEERSALMAEHMQTMRDGMGMVQKMGQSGSMGSMGSMGASKGGKAMACDMYESHRMMGMRMEMMESMMQMMMDRMPSPMAPAAK